MRVKEVGLILLPLLVISVSAEITWARLRHRAAFAIPDSLCNVSIAVVGHALKPVSAAWSFFVLSFFEPLQLFRLPSTVWAFLVSFVIVDFAYYWYHRWSHQWPFLWSFHYTHHSSTWFNFTTALRLNWMAKFITPVAFAPLVILGLSPMFLVAALALNLFLQFFLHTTAIGPLGQFEGTLLNSPSAHRVHHGLNDSYIDKNFAGVFIVWDRLFGTYEPETEPVIYGVTNGSQGNNPFVVQFLPLWRYIQGSWRSGRPTASTLAAPFG